MPKTYTDVLTSFPLGMNSGVAPLLLPKQQLAMLINGTVRGGYVQPRPPFNFQTLNFGGNVGLQAAFENGLFQGGAVYRPDFGSSQAICQISGRLYSLTPVGGSWTVADITIPGDANSATQTQCWMWQAEKWLIISDGSGALPIFYDGVSCRRSMGTSHILGTAIASDPPGGVVPAVNSDIVLTLASDWTYGVNFLVNFHGAHYEVISVGAGPSLGNIQLTNNTGTAGGVIPTGTDIIVNPTSIGLSVGLTTSVGISNGYTCIIGPGDITNWWYWITFDITCTSVTGVSVGNTLSVATSGGVKVLTVTGVAGNVISARFLDKYVHVGPFGSCGTGDPGATIYTIASGTLIQFSTSMGPTVVIGQLSADFTIPAVGVSDFGSMNVPYTGAANQLVSIAGKLYLINSNSGTSGTTLTLRNITDTAGPAYAFNLDITSLEELPACRMGAYGIGQNWVSLVDGLSFICSDIVGSTAVGSAAYDFRDAVLKAENYVVMGSFRLPGAGEFINSMTFTATLDTALGQGPLEIGTLSRMFSVKAPFDLSDFQGSTTYLNAPQATPILTESLIGSGPMAQNSTIAANSDTLFRSVDGLASLKLARRSMNEEWGNTPISLEAERMLLGDNEDLLSLSSAAVFANRLLTTCKPVASAQGTYHGGFVSLNFDLVSSLRGKAPPVYDGLWTGILPFQIITGLFNTSQRTFAFTYDATSQTNGFCEILKATGYDNGTERITLVAETPVIFNQDKKPIHEIIKLTDGEIYLTDVSGIVGVKVYFRPLFWPCWSLWHEFSVCATMTAATAKKQVMMPLGLGQPSATPCDSVNNRPLREGAAFQFRIEITGLATFWGMRVEAVESPQPKYAKVAGCTAPAECLAVECVTQDDFAVYQLPSGRT